MFDYHTHNSSISPGTGIVNLPYSVLLEPESFLPESGGLYSVGIHPWWVDASWEEKFHVVSRLAQHPQVVVVGECGVDLLCGVDLDLQLEVLKQHLMLAERIGKPVTLHVVRGWHHVLSLRKELVPTQRWVVHGFRGKPMLAQQLLSAGFDLSFGEKYNEQSYRITPEERRYHESDAPNPV